MAHLGVTMEALGGVDEAKVMNQQALDLDKQVEHRQAIVRDLVNLARFSEATKQTTEAIQFSDEPFMLAEH